MKIRHLVSCLALFLSLSAITAARADLPSNVLAESRIYGGFTPWPNYENGIRILTNGDIMAFSTRETSKVDVLATLSPQRLKMLKKKIAEFQAGELQDTNPQDPFCADAGTRDYEVRTARGVTVLLARNSACHEFRRPNGEGYQLLELLQSMSAIEALEY